MSADRHDWTSRVRLPSLPRLASLPSLLSEEAIAEAVARVKPPSAGEPYSRTLLHRGPEAEVLLAAWREGARCAPHDHGGARGTVHLLRGRFVERTFEKRGALLVTTSTQTFVAPAEIAVDDGSIRDMEASEGGVSLHVYRPCIRAMRIYDATRSETLVVTDDCGAWIPMDLGQIIAREGWT